MNCNKSLTTLPHTHTHTDAQEAAGTGHPEGVGATAGQLAPGGIRAGVRKPHGSPTRFDRRVGGRALL
jgi:hypothetical protein